MFETFDHTADLGLRIQSADLNSLFSEAACALFSTIVETFDSVRPVDRIEISLSGEEKVYLLFDWLRELLSRFDVEHRLFSRFEVDVRENRLIGAAWGEFYDPDRHELAHEVKAITYHELKLVQVAEGWLAEVIVDI